MFLQSSIAAMIWVPYIVGHVAEIYKYYSGNANGSMLVKRLA